MTNTFKTIAMAGVAVLTLGASVAATMSEANAQAYRGDMYYRYNDPAAPVANAVAGAIETPFAVAGAVTGAIAAPIYAPAADSNFGYPHWPYGNGYRGGWLNSGSSDFFRN
jgi:hypothetical protein